MDATYDSYLMPMRKRVTSKSPPKRRAAVEKLPPLAEGPVAPLQAWDIAVNACSKQFKGAKRDALLEEARFAGVGCLLVSGSWTDAQMNCELSRLHRVPCTLGVHPHKANTFLGAVPWDDRRQMDVWDHDGLRSTLKHCARGKTVEGFLRQDRGAGANVVAWGEMGLDFYRMLAPATEQLNCFVVQVSNACRDPRRRPLYLHERDAHVDFLRVLDAARDVYGELPPCVVHCFTGTWGEAKAYLERGFYLGFTGFICMPKRGSDVRTWLHMVPLGRIMLETDCSYMKPDGMRGVSTPADVYEVADVVAGCHGVGTSEVLRVTRETTERVFQITGA